MIQRKLQSLSVNKKLGLVALIILATLGLWLVVNRSSNIGMVELSGEPTFFYTSNESHEDDGFIKTINFLQPGTGKTQEISIETRDPIYIRTLEQNNSVQFSLSGETIAYATQVRESEAIGSTKQRNSFSVFVGALDAEPNVVIKDKAPGLIADWKLSSDGTKIYYIQQARRENNEVVNPAHLYVYDVASKKLTKIGDVTREQEAYHSRLFEISTDTSIRYYAISDGGLIETSYSPETGKINTQKVIGLEDCSCFIGQNGLSPDGERLIINEADREIYVVDLQGKSIKNIIPKQDGLAFGNEHWLADSSRFTVNSYPFGENIPENPYAVIEIDPSSGKQWRLFEQSESDAALISWGWSANGRYLTYNDGYALKFYDRAKNKHIDGVPNLFEDSYSFDSEQSHDWLQQ